MAKTRELANAPDTIGVRDAQTGEIDAQEMIQDQVEFPFRAKVLGEPVTVVGMEWPEDDEFGLDFMCERNGERHRIEARSVHLVAPLPDGHLYLAAYLDWKRMM